MSSGCWRNSQQAGAPQSVRGWTNVVWLCHGVLLHHDHDNVLLTARAYVEMEDVRSWRDLPNQTSHSDVKSRNRDSSQKPRTLQWSAEAEKGSERERDGTSMKDNYRVSASPELDILWFCCPIGWRWTMFIDFSFLHKNQKILFLKLQYLSCFDITQWVYI